jgi:L-lactate utilization protein LutC
MSAATERDIVLDRVRHAVRAGQAHREPSRALPQAAVGPAPLPDLTDMLVDELRKAGTHAILVQSAADAAAAVAGVITRFAVRSAVVNADPLLDELGVVDCLRTAGVATLTSSELARFDESGRRTRLFEADLGVAAADWAIAETGSLVYAAAAMQVRSTSLLPPVHLAVVDCRRILPDLFDLPARMSRDARGTPECANVVVVTGPSKTGDIELRLTTGVHGPGELHVLVWQRAGER